MVVKQSLILLSHYTQEYKSFEKSEGCSSITAPQNRVLSQKFGMKPLQNPFKYITHWGKILD